MPNSGMSATQSTLHSGFQMFQDISMSFASENIDKLLQLCRFASAGRAAHGFLPAVLAAGQVAAGQFVAGQVAAGQVAAGHVMVPACVSRHCCIHMSCSTCPVLAICNSHKAPQCCIHSASFVWCGLHSCCNCPVTSSVAM